MKGGFVVIIFIKLNLDMLFFLLMLFIIFDIFLLFYKFKKYLVFVISLKIVYDILKSYFFLFYCNNKY